MGCFFVAGIIEVILIVVAWRVGWRWKAFLPSITIFFVNFFIIFISFFNSPSWRTAFTESDDQVRMGLIKESINSFASNQLLMTWFDLSSVIVFGTLLYMIWKKHSQQPSTS